MTPRCEHCKREMAFGKYRLTQAAYSFWTEDRQSGERVKRWVDEKTFEKLLCADCGFNIVNFRKASHNEYVHEITYPSGKKATHREETMSTRGVYTNCVLIEMIENAIPILRAYQEAKMPPRAEYVADLKRLREEKGLAPEPSRPVVVPALGGASPRGSSVLGHGIGMSSPTVTGSVSIGASLLRASPTATTGPSPRRHR